MSYEYYLVPRDAAAGFPPEAQEAMRAWLTQLPTHVAEDGTVLLFRSEEEKALRLRWLRENPGRNDYLTPFIHLGEWKIMLSSVTEPSTDQIFYEFVRWCQERWPCDLHYGSGVVDPELLLAEP